MTELNSYSITTTLNIDLSQPEIVTAANNTTVKSNPQLPVLANHYPRLDSKLILQNMEEVLDSVKKQHKEKHRRKKELKKLAMTEAAASGTVNVSLTHGMSKDKKREQHSEKKRKHKDKEKRHSKKDPLQEKSSIENCSVKLQESPIKSGTILQHFQRTPKKEDQDDEVEVIVEQSESEEGTEPLNTKVTNAFEVMMNARNKSIGSNTPGKESLSPIVDKKETGASAKRKLKLQEWAEQKGGAKRKLDEEARAAYVEEQLEQRAKRFKQMLVAGAACPNNSASTSSAKLERETKSENKNKLKDNTADKSATKKRKATRSRRLSSKDSINSLELPRSPTKVDKETSEFLSKLNSPTKKRDSLLGYFEKKDSPKETEAKKFTGVAKKLNENAKTETPKSRNKKGLCNQTTTIESHNQLKEIKQSESCTSSGRPRRSCTGRTRYDYDLDVSPSKSNKNEANTPTRKTITRKGNTKKLTTPKPESVDTIILDDSTNMSMDDSTTTTPQGTPKKLAPLFVKTLPKPGPDPEILKARQAFLQSGVPEKLRLEQEKQKQYEQNFEETTEIFPKISHIKQLGEDELVIDSKTVICSLKFKEEESTPSPTRKSKTKSSKRSTNLGSLTECLAFNMELPRNKCLEFSLDKIVLPSLANKREIIKSWKTEFDRFPTYKCYNQMREKYRYFSAIDSAQDTEQVSESFVVTRQTRRSLQAQQKKELDNPDEEYKPPATAPNGELLFCEKYKPLLFEQVLVNLNPVAQLKDFLSNWSQGGSGSGSAKNSQTLDDSMDFNDYASCSNQGPSSNTVVLLGPASSGKTNAVFALANEMNFNVLEINAGMKRTGKRLIQELQEATQSHQIRKDSAGSVSSQKSLLKMSLGGLKTKLKKPGSTSAQLDTQNSDSNSSEQQQQSARKCLILIEDADIVFEQTDGGFTDAIYSLAASSKRPVIVVASDPNCNHLQRLIAQNSIYFSSPNVLNISKFLAVLSLMENCPVHLDDLISLYLYNQRDLRKTLLELQFFIQSGGDRQRQLEQNKQKDSTTTVRETANYFASPRKRQFSVEQQESETADNTIPTDKNNSAPKTTDQVYMHRSLFEFYTVGQNSKWRIPFPIDFHLLNANLNDIFQTSQKLKAVVNSSTGEESKPATKRRTKSPKKQWLTIAKAQLNSPLDNLCSFYENLSTAALMDERNDHHILQFKEKQNLSIVDRLQPNISETIAHCLLEKSIEVNLEADFCPYNLFDTPKNSVSLCKELGSMQCRSNRARYLDYEPYLRSICRSEKMRSNLERRSSRFYHYLRNYTTNISNFSTTHFDQACEVFQANCEQVNSALAKTTS